MRKLLLIACCAAGAAQADTLVCKGKIVQIGVTVTELRAKCGAPTSKQVETVDVRGMGPKGSIKTGESSTETWRYDRGNSSFTAVVVIRDGAVVAITFE